MSVRTDNVFGRAHDASNRAAAYRPVGCTLVEMENLRTPLPRTDPVKTHNVRKESDAVFLFAVNLMAREGVQLHFGRETGDFITPDVVPYSCLLSVRARESGEPGMVLLKMMPKPGAAPVKTEPRRSKE